MRGASNLSGLSENIATRDRFHYSDVIIGVMASQTASLRIVYPNKAQIKENIKVPRPWPLWGEFTGNRWIPCTKGQ